jgi:hypothetical protein
MLSKSYTPINFSSKPFDKKGGGKMSVKQEVSIQQEFSQETAKAETGSLILMPGVERDLLDALPSAEVDLVAFAELRCGSCSSGNSGNSGSGSRSGNSSCRSGRISTEISVDLGEKAA